MRAVLIWTINNFPTYAMLSMWSSWAWLLTAGWEAECSLDGFWPAVIVVASGSSDDCCISPSTFRMRSSSSFMWLCLYIDQFYWSDSKDAHRWILVCSWCLVVCTFKCRLTFSLFLSIFAEDICIQHLDSRKPYRDFGRHNESSWVCTVDMHW